MTIAPIVPFRLRVLGGFTLIELMIILAVIAVLAMVATPSFLDSIRKGRRAEAVAALAQVQQAQERWRANNGSYADNDKLTLAQAEGGLGISATTSNRLYDVAVSNVSASGYTVTATAREDGAQASDSACQKLVLRLAGGNIFYTSVNAANADSTASGRCWNR